MTAIVGYAEILRDEAGRLELQATVADLNRILTSAQALFELVDHLLDIDSGTLDRRRIDSTAAVQALLCHDLRNPLNAAKGYAELLLEDLDEIGQAHCALIWTSSWPKWRGCSRRST